MPDELKLPRLGEELLFIWELYKTIKSGCETLTYEAINAYLNITRSSLTKFELDCLMAIERKRIEVLHG